MIQDHLVFFFENLFFDENLLINSNIIEIIDGENENKVSNWSEFTISYNNFLNHSFFLNHEYLNKNETLVFCQIKIQNNFSKMSFGKSILNSKFF